MNVSELITLLQSFPPAAQVGVLTLNPSGVVIDVDTAPVVTVEQTIADDGTADAVWITGVGATGVAPPTLITWPCQCGELLVIDHHATWPHEHDSHLNDINYRL